MDREPSSLDRVALDPDDDRAVEHADEGGEAPCFAHLLESEEFAPEGLRGEGAEDGEEHEQ